MKTLLLFLLVCSTGFAQEFTITPSGLVSKADNTQNYIVVDLGAIPSDTLYNNAKKYIQGKYTGPRDTVNSDDANKSITFNTANVGMITVKKKGADNTYFADYTCTVDVKDGKGRVIFTNPTIYTANAGEDKKLMPLNSYFNSKGKVVDAETKKIVEDYFNASARLLVASLKGENSKATGW